MPHNLSSRRESLAGAFYATAAFFIWGVSPVYWKAIGRVPAVEIIAHRVAWSLGLLVILVLLQRRWGEFRAALKAPATMLTLAATTLLLGGNWLLYIWAVNSGYMLQGSLGYYINPLVNVVLGKLFFQERLRRPQLLAVLLAVAAVAFLTCSYGELPWIALALALSFGCYGLIRKKAAVGSLVGLTIETLILAPPAAAYLIYLEIQGTGVFLRVSPVLDGLLVAIALLTAFPLLFFNLGARRLDLSTLGLLQYLAPSLMFLLAVLVYDEPFTAAQLWTFLAIWTALGIYSFDSIKTYRRAA